MPDSWTAPLALGWGLFGLYLALTYWLAWLGHKRTDSFASFAIGKGDMGAGVAGLTLGACLASTATFVINPGFVYRWGLPALLALTVPFVLGIFAGLAVLGPGFRRHGARATTLPIWLGDRYGSGGLRLWFALLSVLHVFYVVLIVVGAAYVMKATLGLDYAWSVTVVVGVVFSYVFLGGTYAHAFTNTAQGALMLVVAVAIFVQALRALGGPDAALDALAAQDPRLVAAVDPTSPYYATWFEVLVCPFVIGFALVSQPHLLVKSLYVRTSKDVVTLSLVGGACFVVFSLVLVAGLAARLQLGDGQNLNAVTSVWLAQAFPPMVGAVVGVTILAAAMSTLDGLLVAVSCIVGGDLATHPVVARRLRLETPEAVSRAALRAGRWTLIALGLVAWLLSGGLAVLAPALARLGLTLPAWTLSPPALVGIFGTVGAYGLVIAALPAILYGLRARPPAAWTVGVASVVALGLHLGLYALSQALGAGLADRLVAAGWDAATLASLARVGGNTGLTATLGLLLALPLPAALEALARRAAPAPSALPPAEAPAPSASQRLALAL